MEMNVSGPFVYVFMCLAILVVGMNVCTQDQGINETEDFLI